MAAVYNLCRAPDFDIGAVIDWMHPEAYSRGVGRSSPCGMGKVRNAPPALLEWLTRCGPRQRQYRLFRARTRLVSERAGQSLLHLIESVRLLQPGAVGPFVGHLPIGVSASEDERHAFPLERFA